mmetsp:Transcript_18552/g.25799  ORF Transcript_18552/g.25799 Transcript_18552/m.25799 type:complete len:154 (+) Transcript_18552:240-701(+)
MVGAFVVKWLNMEDQEILEGAVTEIGIDTEIVMMTDTIETGTEIEIAVIAIVIEVALAGGAVAMIHRIAIADAVEEMTTTMRMTGRTGTVGGMTTMRSVIIVMMIEKEMMKAKKKTAQTNMKEKIMVTGLMMKIDDGVMTEITVRTNAICFDA